VNGRFPDILWARATQGRSNNKMSRRCMNSSNNVKRVSLNESGGMLQI
jgi:hypothetical protein